MQILSRQSHHLVNGINLEDFVMPALGYTYDDDPTWVDVPDRHLLVADADGVSVAPL